MNSQNIANDMTLDDVKAFLASVYGIPFVTSFVIAMEGINNEGQQLMTSFTSSDLKPWVARGMLETAIDDLITTQRQGVAYIDVSDMGDPFDDDDYDED